MNNTGCLRLALIISLLTLPSCASGGMQSAWDSTVHVISAPYHYVFDDEDDPMDD